MLISPVRTASTPTQAPKIKAADTPAPAPAPSPDTDISTLDSAPKVAVLPALTATTMLMTLGAMASAAQANAGLTSSVDVTVGSGGKDAAKESITYTLAQNPYEHTFTLNGKGTLGSTGAGEKWILSQQGLLVNGSFGNAVDVKIEGPGPINVSFVPENIKVSPTAKGLKVEGDVGGVHVSETMTPSSDGQTIDFAGTIGDRAIAQTLTMGADSSGKPQMHVEGHLGDDAIKYDETLTPQDQNNFQLSGQGVIAGYNVQIDHKLSFDPKNPPPQGN